MTSTLHSHAARRTGPLGAATAPDVLADLGEFVSAQGPKNILRFLPCQEGRPGFFGCKTGNRPFSWNFLFRTLLVDAGSVSRGRVW